METEKRKGRKPLPVYWQTLLNEQQTDSLEQLASEGWQVRFVRMPKFEPTIIALYNQSIDQFGILEEDGGLDTASDLKVRNE